MTTSAPVLPRGRRRHRLRPVGWRDVFAVREFRGLFAAQLTSYLGDQLAKIALAILVFDRTSSALLGSLTYAVTLLPALLSGPLLGWVADRRPRREVMIACDLGRAALVAPMLIPGMPTAALLALLFGASFLDTPFAAARSALLPDVLEGDRYAHGQAIGSTAYQLSQVVGFGVGGALVAILGARGALTIDVATFLVSAAVVRMWSPRRPARDVAAVDNRWSLLTDGAAEVVRRADLRGLLSITALSLALLVATEGLAVAYARELGHGAVATGLLTAAVPVGTAVGALLAARVPARFRVPSLRILMVAWAIPLVATVARPPIWLAYLLWGVAGLCASAQILANVEFSRLLRPDNRGRVFAFAQSSLVAVQGVGLVVAGVLARFTSPSDAIAIAGLAGVVGCGAIALTIRTRSSTTGSSPVDEGRYGVVPAEETVAPGAVVSRRRQQVRTALAYAVSVAVLAGGFVAVAMWHPAPLVRHGPQMPWWLLAAVFVAVALAPLHFQRRDSSHYLYVAEVPMLLGLFFSRPLGLLLGVTIGLSVVEARRSSPLKFLVNRAASALEVTVAVGVVHLLAQSARSVDSRQLVAAGVAVLASNLTGFCFISAVRGLVQDDLRVRDLRDPFAFLALTSVTAASVGLLAVVALAANAAAGVVLVVVGLLLAGGFRAFTNLQERHAGLGRLYALQEHMGALVPRGDSLFPVMRETRTLLLASEVSVELPEGAGRRVLVIDAGDRATEVWTPAETLDADPSRWSPPTGMSVALRDGDREIGLLRVGRRLGRIRAYNQSDLRLLETLAAHVGDALHRGTLIERLHEAATHDPLTGLLALNELMRQLDESLVREQSCVVAVLDVERLQEINDSLGHQAGDALLCQVAERLRESSPAHALLARGAGGEFVVAASVGHEFEAASLVEVLLAAVSGLVQVLDVTVDLRSRIGWLLTPYDGSDAATVVRRADLALSGGRDAFELVTRFRSTMDVDGRRRLQLVNDLRLALQDGALDVVYQPLVTPVDGRVVGCEALVRWNHAVLGAVSPDEFVRVAEQSGLISDLTDYVLDRALAQTRRWHDAGRDIHVAVNLSARCLTDMSLPGRVVDMLARNRLTAAALTLEVTETSVAEDPNRALAVLSRLRGIGITLSIDDFGTGYSSLASLKRFPVQEVKLDRSFLIDLDVESDDEAASDLALLRAVVALGHSMHLRIVAEGVETPQAYRRLASLGVDVLQGYVIGRPGPADALPNRVPPEALVPGKQEPASV